MNKTLRSIIAPIALAGSLAGIGIGAYSLGKYQGIQVGKEKEVQSVSDAIDSQLDNLFERENLANSFKYSGTELVLQDIGREVSSLLDAKGFIDGIDCKNPYIRCNKAENDMVMYKLKSIKEQIEKESK